MPTIPSAIYPIFFSLVSRLSCLWPRSLCFPPPDIWSMTRSPHRLVCSNPPSSAGAVAYLWCPYWVRFNQRVWGQLADSAAALPISSSRQPTALTYKPAELLKVFRLEFHTHSTRPAQTRGLSTLWFRRLLETRAPTIRAAYPPGLPIYTLNITVRTVRHRSRWISQISRTWRTKLWNSSMTWTWQKGRITNCKMHSKRPTKRRTR